MTSIYTTENPRFGDELPVASFNLLKVMVDAAEDAIAVKNRDLVYLTCNAAFLQMYGKSEEEVIGQTDTDISSEQIADLCRQSDRLVLETGETVKREECVNTSHGLRCFQVTKSPLRGDSGEIDGIVMVSRDVSERMQAEESGQQHADRYATLLNISHDGFMIMGTDGTFHDVNQAFCELTGYSREEFLQLHISDLDMIEAPDETAAHINKVIQQGYDRFETRYRRKDGMIIDVEISTSYWEPSSYFLVFCRDITDRLRAEAERQRYEAQLDEARKLAERESHAKTRFLATASHDLRQPIQAMHLLSSLLVSNELPRESAEIAFRMQEAVDGLGEMLSALLDISKLDAGLVTPDLSEFRINDLLLTLTSEYIPVARERGIELKSVYSSLCVRSDQNLLSRILRNLISNAIKYTSSGTILVGVRRVGETARIQVLDTGIGIGGDELERVFEEFHQLGNTARDRREGLGLGLAIVERLASLLGHSVEVSSQPGRGTCFSVHVPIASEIEDLHEWLPDNEPLSPVPCKGAEILVVDDEIDIREGLEMTLSHWGYVVSMAADYEQAMAAIDEEKPPVMIIADYRLGARTGIDVIRDVRRQSKSKIPALLLTGDATEERAREAARLDVRLLRKPVSGEQLRRAVIECLRTA